MHMCLQNIYRDKHSENDITYTVKLYGTEGKLSDIQVFYLLGVNKCDFDFDIVVFMILVSEIPKFELYHG